MSRHQGPRLTHQRADLQRWAPGMLVTIMDIVDEPVGHAQHTAAVFSTFVIMKMFNSARQLELIESFKPFVREINKRRES